MKMFLTPLLAVNLRAEKQLSKVMIGTGILFKYPTKVNLNLIQNLIIRINTAFWGYPSIIKRNAFTANFSGLTD